MFVTERQSAFLRINPFRSSTIGTKTVSKAMTGLSLAIAGQNLLHDNATRKAGRLGFPVRCLQDFRSQSRTQQKSCWLEWRRQVICWKQSGRQVIGLQILIGSLVN